MKTCSKNSALKTTKRAARSKDSENSSPLNKKAEGSKYFDFLRGCENSGCINS
jgi:hypothetical protein